MLLREGESGREEERKRSRKNSGMSAVTCTGSSVASERKRPRAAPEVVPRQSWGWWGKDRAFKALPEVT